MGVQCLTAPGLWWEEVPNFAMQPCAELFEHIHANILLPHLSPMQGGCGNTQLPGELPVWDDILVIGSPTEGYRL
jgi:hypothetical protein